MTERTPSERLAYLQGYEAGIRHAVALLARIAEVTNESATNLQSEVALVQILNQRISR